MVQKDISIRFIPPKNQKQQLISNSWHTTDLNCWTVNDCSPGLTRADIRADMSTEKESLTLRRWWEANKTCSPLSVSSSCLRLSMGTCYHCRIKLISSSVKYWLNLHVTVGCSTKLRKVFEILRKPKPTPTSLSIWIQKVVKSFKSFLLFGF